MWYQQIKIPFLKLCHIHTFFQLLLISGCELHGYSSDITRTWPINGKFSPHQREVYEVVLDVQKQLIKECETFPTLDSLFDTMCALLGKGLQQIGLIPKILTNQALIKVRLSDVYAFSNFLFARRRISSAPTMCRIIWGWTSTTRP